MRLLLTGLLTAAVLSACSLLGGPDTPPPAAGCGGDPDLVVLCEALAIIREEYVDTVSDDQLVEAGIEGVGELGGEDDSEDEGGLGDLECDIADPVAAPICRAVDETDVAVETGVGAALTSMAVALDPHSAYLDPESLDLVEEQTSGEVEGIGALVGAEDRTGPDGSTCAIVSDTCRLVVVSTFPSSPARQAGLLPGDAIVEVDGAPVDGLHFDEVTALVRGPAGTDVAVGFLRDGNVDRIEITRAAVEIPVVQSELFDSTGYVRLNVFTDRADAQLRPALEDLIEGGATRIVLDLRDNPGGTLQSAIRVTSEFLAEGEVVVTESPERRDSYAVTGDGIATDPDLDLVVAINRGSASAAEVTAGVLGETGRATLVGEPSFGKNTVQQRFPLSDGGALKLTIARWLTPAGDDFGEDGITPDIPLDLPFDLTPTEVVTRIEGAL